MKRLQAEWKTVGPVRRNKSEVVWNRFRAAADRFFTRFHNRHQITLATKIAEREVLVVELERLAESDPERAGSRRARSAASHDVEPQRADPGRRVQGADRSLARGADPRGRRGAAGLRRHGPRSGHGHPAHGEARGTRRSVSRGDRATRPKACRTPNCSPPSCGPRSRPTRWAAGSTRTPSGAPRPMPSRTRRRPGSGWRRPESPVVEALSARFREACRRSQRTRAAASARRRAREKRRDA